MLERFTDGARRAIHLAYEEARRLGHARIGTEHLLLGLVPDDASVAGRALQASGITLGVVRQQVDEVAGSGQAASSESVSITPELYAVLGTAERAAAQIGHAHIGTEHLLLGLLDAGDGITARVLAASGTTADELRRRTIDLLTRYLGDDPAGELLLIPRDSLFHKYGTVLTAHDTGLTRGRDAEVERVMQILSRRQRYNPVLIGEPGVGKTAIVDRLAARISGQHAPTGLRGKHVLAIAPARLVAGVRNRVQLDALMSQLVSEITKFADTRAVIFFDELHELTRVQAFDAEIGDVLAPVLEAGYRMLAATTASRFRQCAERNPLLERDCEPVEIMEPSADGIIDILDLVRPRLEAHHQVPITDDALRAAVTLARRYRTNRALPGSAIDILDDTAALLAVRLHTRPDHREIDRRIAEVRGDREGAIDDRDFPRAAELQAAEYHLYWQRTQREQEWEQGNPDMVREVTGEQVAATLGVDLGAIVTPQAVAYRAQAGGIQLPVRDRSAAILIGAGRFTDSRLPDMPAITQNLHDLRRALTADTGLFEPARVHVFDQFEHGDLKAIATLAQATADTLVVYYAGHGLNENDDLYLAFADTDRDQPQFTGLGYDKIRHLVTTSPARRCIVILDCCYAGKVIEWMGPGDATAAGELDIRGTYVLTATGVSDKAIAPQGDRHTAFTGALLRLMREGIDNGREFLCVSDLHPRLTAELRSRNLPQPRQRPVDSIGSLAIARNVAWRGVQPGDDDGGR